MAKIGPFQGFPKQGLEFLRGLEKNNNKQWFDENRKDYESGLLEPAKAFVVAMGERLRAISPGIVAEPKVNGSLFRINRDTRFSKDKSPYKTNIGIFFWEGGPKKMESTGFYFHLQPEVLMCGVGMPMFPKGLIETYREAVIDEKLGAKLRAVIEDLGPAYNGHPDRRMPIEAYKRVPRGYDPEHPNAELLKLKGLHAGLETPIPSELHSAKLVDHCFERFQHLAPLHFWLLEMMGSPF